MKYIKQKLTEPQQKNRHIILYYERQTYTAQQ